jgi:hypothetical protein
MARSADVSFRSGFEAEWIHVMDGLGLVSMLFGCFQLKR